MGSQAGEVARRVAGAPLSAGLGFWTGFRYPLRGMRFVYVEHRGLVRFWIVPILLTFAALSGALWLSWHWYDTLTEMMWSEPVGEGLWIGVQQFFHGLVEVLVGVILSVVGVVVVIALTTIVAAPFNDALSEEVERIVTGEKGPPFRLRALLRDVGRTVRLEVAKLLLYLAVMGPLFLASLLIPVVGQAAFSVFSFVFTAMYFAIDYVDWPIARRNRGVRYRFALAKGKGMTLFGFGAGVWLFLFVPLVNLFFMPAAVAGGTLLFLDIEATSDDVVAP